MYKYEGQYSLGPTFDINTLAWEAALESNRVYDDLLTIESRLDHVDILANSGSRLPEVAFDDMRTQLSKDYQTKRDTFDRLTGMAAFVMSMPDSPFEVVAESAEPTSYNSGARFFKSPEAPKDLLDRRASGRGLNCETSYSLRDMLVLGKDYMKEGFDSRLLKVRRVEASIAEANPQLKWEKAPSVADIVQFCSTLDQVTAARVGGYGEGMSVHDVLVMPITELATALDRLLWGAEEPSPEATLKALDLKRRAYEFALEFYQERAKIV